MESKTFNNIILSDMTVGDFCDWLLKNIDEDKKILFNGNSVVHVSINTETDYIELFSVQKASNAKIDYEKEESWDRLSDKKNITIGELTDYLIKIDRDLQHASHDVTVNGNSRIKFYRNGSNIEITS